MDPQNDLPDLVEDLEVNIDELTTTLAPLLNTQLSTTASSLPLLDTAKLYVLAAYSIESLLYSTVQASGVNAKEHAIFKELARLKGYFGKIKSVEERTITSAAPKSKLDVGAAARFIKHGLAGNEKYDLERAERQAKERARAQLKARQINKKFDDEGGEETPLAKKRDIEDVVAAAAEEDTNEDVMTGLEEATAPSPTEPAPKKAKLADSQTGSARRSKRGKKKSKSAEPSDADDIDSQPSQSQSQSQETSQEPTSRPKRKQRGKKSGSKPSSPAELDVEENITVQPSTATPVPVRKTRSSDASAAVVSGGDESAQNTPDGAEKPKRGRGRPKKAK